MQSSTIHVVGSANLDLVFQTPRFPNPGETLLGGSFSEFPGGKGANQAVAIGKLGGEVRFIGAVGGDGFGQSLLSSLKASQVHTDGVAVLEGQPSGTALILVDGNGENMIVVASGANSELSSEHVANQLDCSGNAIVLAQLEIPIEAVMTASESGRFILNPAPARSLSRELYQRCMAITPNESETEFLTGISPSDEPSAMRACEFFLANGVQNVVITMGSRGCFWTNGTDSCFSSAPRVSAIDTTAAGDAFNGALALSLASEASWQEAIEFANYVAALSTTRPGAQSSMPTRSEVDNFIAEYSR